MTSLSQDHELRLARAKISLNGLSIGDAFGERFFCDNATVDYLISNRALPPAPWIYTDDTVMALSIFEVLELKGEIDQDLLACGFAAKYVADTSRGYGLMAHQILRKIAAGADWREVSNTAFGGAGSLGNGGAMRVAPVGGFFADDLDQVVEQARRSAEVTHAHSEGQAGAIAVAIAAALSCLKQGSPREILEAAADYTPRGTTHEGIVRAQRMPFETPIPAVVKALGNGSNVTSQDTVPFALWCAARHLDNFEEALWSTVSGLGDRDTTCAIVGGVVALADDGQSIPAAWYEAREPLSRLSKLGVHAS